MPTLTQSPIKERLLYSRKEAAAVLSLSVTTVARDIALGRIKTTRYGRRVLIPRDELLRITTQGMSGQAP